jgi:hypothetical protein
MSADDPAMRQLPQVERISAPEAATRVRLSAEDDEADVVHLEVVLHAGLSAASPAILSGFGAWASFLEAQLDFDRLFDIGGLTFIPVTVAREAAVDLARFSFLRVARSMPRLRSLRPAMVVRSRRTPSVELPTNGPVDPELQVAIFDGGVEASSPLAPWVSSHAGPTVGTPDEDDLDHGFEVTGALLFGELGGNGDVPVPYSHVDHYQVLDDKSGDDPDELYDVLQRIRDVLATRDYEFVNLSIGPCLPIEDDDVHLWTVALDELLSDGSTLLTAAVGNWGDLDRSSGNARIQPPSDCVNALGVGAADSMSSTWDRAEYSCVGPGRSPGLVKPDVLAFGGSSLEPFFALHRDRPGRTVGLQGTSYAAPLALRTALGARALLGPRVSPLALKALLVHSAEAGDLDREDVGWGRIPVELEDLVVCQPGRVRVLYQGWLEPRRYLRASVPMPARELRGLVTITATITYAAPIDPAHSGAYTRAGLDVIFRPHSGRIAVERGATVAQSSPFFQASQYSEEDERRRDAHKWETVLSRSRRMRGSSLQAPAFDIHYNARYAGADAPSANRVRYAAVITVDAPREPEIYNEIVTHYAGTLEPLLPVVDIPLRVIT